jgi:anti-sigma B factor antagonist
LKIYQIFMVPNAIASRLFTTMQNIDTNWQMGSPVAGPVAFEAHKESKLKLSLETRNRGDVVIVHGQGRIVYRDEAAAMSRVVGEVLEEKSKVVLDLSGVSVMDSAGIGELALLESWAQERKADLKCAGANTTVRALLELTNLDSVLAIYPTVEAALEAFPEEEEEVCADC